MSERIASAAAQVTQGQEGMSSIKEVLAGWNDVARLLRGGDSGSLVPVVIPKDTRPLRWLSLVWLSLWSLITAIILLPDSVFGSFLLTVGIIGLIGSAIWWWRSSIVEIEEGTVGVLTRFGAIHGHGLSPGRHYLWHPWKRVAYVVDVTTEIPYAAPVLSSPTAENVPLKSIEFFLRFRILDAIRFVQTIGAGNFDLVLSNSVQDAIRQRSRKVRTERAYDLRGSDVKDMQELLNRQLTRYGVQIMGCNIPDVQLPDQYREHLSTREKVSKELVAYEKEWELTRKRRIDTLLMEIERSKKVRAAKIVEVNASLNKARKDVAQMLEERETEAQKVKYEIETRARTNLVAAQGEAKAREQLATAYRDNQAVLGYELALRRLEVGAQLADSAPRPVIVHTDPDGGGDNSALSTLLMAQLIPQLGEKPKRRALLGGGAGAAGAAGAADEAAEAVAGTNPADLARRAADAVRSRTPGGNRGQGGGRGQGQ